jgi:curved DNA-binding protein CbpA
MSFKIERGLFKFDFIDHHAVLGIPVNADVKEVRKRYLKIARNLHPDSSKAGSEAEKKQANQLLSKLVNPAYEQLSQSNNRDYLVSLGHMGRRLAGEGGKISISSEAAKQLTRSGPNLDNLYKNLVQNLAAKQYESLDQTLDKIAEISELNMVYLMIKGSRGEGPKLEERNKAEVAGGDNRRKPDTPAGTQRKIELPGNGQDGTEKLGDSQVISRIGEYIRRAEGYMVKNNFAGAVLELREALKMDQNNSQCHSLLGIAYLKQNQTSMARVHINKALQLNPKDERALKCKQYLEKLAQKSGGKPSAPPKQAPGKPSDQSGGSGIFGNWFGGKKK